mmetsp:Transcript_27666/g.65504  ORF Transcript_27666/g.65504 Transcript_27666/m.65504 type:complete len:232 (+) Transcript_27666:107-802(+)
MPSCSVAPVLLVSRRLGAPGEEAALGFLREKLVRARGVPCFGEPIISGLSVADRWPWVGGAALEGNALATCSDEAKEVELLRKLAPNSRGLPCRKLAPKTLPFLRVLVPPCPFGRERSCLCCRCQISAYANPVSSQASVRSVWIGFSPAARRYSAVCVPVTRSPPSTSKVAPMFLSFSALCRRMRALETTSCQISLLFVLGGSPSTISCTSDPSAGCSLRTNRRRTRSHIR